MGEQVERGKGRGKNAIMAEKERLTVWEGPHRSRDCGRLALVGRVPGSDPYHVLLEWNQAQHHCPHSFTIVHLLVNFPFRFHLGTQRVA